MKYQVIVNIDGYQETISIHNTPDKAIDKMLKAAKATIAECFKEGTEFSAYPTSDERYNGNIRFCGGAISQRIGCVIYGCIGGIHTT